jgi:geranylgeranyl diphosphate synthase type I
MPKACNAGDGMFSLAHLAFNRLSGRGLPAATVLRATRVFGETSVALTEGQFLDMAFEQRLDVTPAEYFRMIAGKTGALLAAAPEIGALIALGETSKISETVRERIIAVYRQYGAMLGRAFQLQDDLLGIWGDEAATGKSAANDILSKKKSLPVVHALSHPTVGAELKALYAGPAFTLADVPVVLTLLAAAGARDYTAAQVRLATQQARAALTDAEPFAAPEAHRLLGELLDVLVDRNA